MFSDGRIGEYSWLWDWEKQSWKPLENTPPSLMSPMAAHEKTETSSKAVSWEQVEALCYGGDILLNGRLDLITETGCVLVSGHHGGDPKLAVGVRVSLNLFDKKSKGSLETSVRVVNIERKDSNWVYRLRWGGIPQL